MKKKDLIVIFDSIRLKKNTGVFLLLFFISRVANAQYADTMAYHIKAQLSGVFNKTNTTKSFLANNGIQYSMTRVHTSFNWNGNWAYGKQNGGITNNDFSSIMDYNLYNKKERLYAWWFAAYDKSYSLKIINRLQAGFGLGYIFVNNDVLNLNVSEGIIYENSDLDQTADPNVMDIETFRNSLRLKYTLNLNKIIVLHGSNYWQQSLERHDDYIIKSMNSLNVKIREWLSLSVVMNYNKINITQRENFLLTYGLTFDKFF